MQGDETSGAGRERPRCGHAPDATLDEAINWRVRLHVGEDANLVEHADWLAGCSCRTSAWAQAQGLWDILGLALARDAGQG